jgi:hypothetical protein
MSKPAFETEPDILNDNSTPVTDYQPKKKSKNKDIINNDFEK